MELKPNLQATAARRGEEFAFLEGEYYNCPLSSNGKALLVIGSPELLSINVPTAPAPVKRKPKTNTNLGTNIKDVLSKAASNEQTAEGNSGSISGFQRGAKNTQDINQEVGQEDSMDIS